MLDHRLKIFRCRRLCRSRMLFIGCHTALFFGAPQCFRTLCFLYQSLFFPAFFLGALLCQPFLLFFLFRLLFRDPL